MHGVRGSNCSRHLPVYAGGGYLKPVPIVGTTTLLDLSGVFRIRKWSHSNVPSQCPSIHEAPR